MYVHDRSSSIFDFCSVLGPIVRTKTRNEKSVVHVGIHNSRSNKTQRIHDSAVKFNAVVRKFA